MVFLLLQPCHNPIIEPKERLTKMSFRRLAHIPGFNIDRVAAAAGADPDVLRMENLDTDIPA
jgi:hypothetical protein